MIDSIPCSFRIRKVLIAFSVVVMAASSVKIRSASIPHCPARYFFISPASLWLPGLLCPVTPPVQTRIASGKDRAAAAAASHRPISSGCISPFCNW